MRDWSGVHEELSVFLEESGQKKHVELPRGHLKTSIVTKGWTIQQVLRNMDVRVLLANAVWDNSRRFLRSIQKYVGMGSILELYFGRFLSDHWNQDECTVRQRKKVLDAPTWSTTGLEKEQTSQHYDLIVADDLVARENVMTSDQREKVLLYYKDLFDLLEPDGTIVVVGTRWHQDDLYARILEEGTWDTFIRTAYKDDGEPVFKEKFSPEHLDDLRKTKGPYEFSAQYLNNPIDESACDFKKSWIRFYDPQTPSPHSLYLTVDPAISLSRDADYSAFVVAGQFRDRRIRVVEAFHKKVIPNELVDEVFRLVQKWKLHRIGIETFAFQKTLKYEIERKQRAEGFFFSVDELGRRNAGAKEAPVSKEARIRRLQPYFEQGLVEVRPDMTDLQDELLSFPRGRHDDLMDALSYQLDYLVPSLDRPQTNVDIEQKMLEGGRLAQTMSWWLKQLPDKETTIYERFMAS